jgi:hypothetical protein
MDTVPTKVKTEQSFVNLVNGVLDYTPFEIEVYP